MNGVRLQSFLKLSITIIIPLTEVKHFNLGLETHESMIVSVLMEA